MACPAMIDPAAFWYSSRIDTFTQDASTNGCKMHLKTSGKAQPGLRLPLGVVKVGFSEILQCLESSQKSHYRGQKPCPGGLFLTSTDCAIICSKHVISSKVQKRMGIFIQFKAKKIFRIYKFNSV